MFFIKKEQKSCSNVITDLKNYNLLFNLTLISSTYYGLIYIYLFVYVYLV